MTKMLARAAALLLAASLAPLAAAPGAPVLPDWQASTPAGEAVRLSEIRGDRASVVLFWATWCPYCQALMPHLQRVADQYQQRGVPFLAVNVWDDGDPAAYLREHGHTFTLLLDGESAADAWGVEGTPGLMVIDSARRVRYQRVSGAEPEAVSAAVSEALEALLDSP